MLFQNKQLILIIIFSLIYLIYLFKKSTNKKIEFYDTFFLTLVVFLPLLLMILPNIEEITFKIFGVVYPFVILFSLLFVVVFVLVLRLIIKINILQDQTNKLIQLIALNKLKNKNKNKKIAYNKK
tara:strand:+ start:745 stop:1119 length:375 start_codon:yes stop_codon:yes gene_type:complete